MFVLFISSLVTVEIVKGMCLRSVSILVPVTTIGSVKYVLPESVCENETALIKQILIFSS